MLNSNSHLLIDKKPILTSDVIHAIKQVAPMKLQSSFRSSKNGFPANTPKKQCLTFINNLSKI